MAAAASKHSNGNKGRIIIDPVYGVWLRVRGPFALPQNCHDCTLDDWEVFDVDKAGCRQCGRFHQCRDGGECPGFMDHDHQACEITGCWIRSRNFQQGFTDTAMPSSSSTGSSSVCTVDPNLSRIWVESTHVARWLHVLIHSDTAKRCINREIGRVSDKASIAFARIAKAFKLEGRQPNMLEMLAETRFVLGNLRVPCRVSSQRMFDELVRACVAAILTFTGNFRKILVPYVPAIKLDHFVIGLIYLLRNGIVMFDTLHVVPRIPALRRLLPMETCLKAHFKIPCKIITEVENLTKIALKSLDRKRVKALMGVSSAAEHLKMYDEHVEHEGRF